jgi:hypothetical protein
MLSAISVLADSEAIADELNPLTISHTPRNGSVKPPGRNKINPVSWPKMTNKDAVNANGAPIYVKEIRSQE